jgi:hypothetical protein
MYGTAQNIGVLAEKQANASSWRLKNSLVKVHTTFFRTCSHNVGMQGFLKKE